MITEITPEIRSKLFEKLDSYLIIGAFDGISHDDVVPLISQKQERQTTKVIFVEPIPIYFEKLKSYKSELKLSDENIFLENCCAGDTACSIEMAYFNPQATGPKPWYIEGCACVVENGTPLNKHIQEEIPKEDLLFIKVPCLTPAEILQKNKFKTVDYLQLDTEGYDQRIVESLDLEALGIKYLKFEAFYCTQEFIESIEALANQLGFYFFKDWDIHLIKKELIDFNIEKDTTPPNIEPFETTVKDGIKSFDAVDQVGELLFDYSFWEKNFLSLKEKLNSIDLHSLAVQIRNEDYAGLGRGYFVDKSGKEHYRLLAYLSLSINNIDFLDIGTLHGYSALALSINPTNRIHTVDVTDQFHIINPPSNIQKYYFGNPSDYKFLIEKSKIIFLDTFHTGDFELQMLKYLKTLDFKGIVIFDDIYCNKEMISFWESISVPKLDLTEIGHSSGTGLLFFK